MFFVLLNKRFNLRICSLYTISYVIGRTTFVSFVIFPEYIAFSGMKKKKAAERGTN